LLINICIVKSMFCFFFSVVMYGYESWTIKKANSRRIDAFELWCWRRLLRVPWTARRLNQSILKEIIPEYPLEGLLLKLKLQYFVPMMQSWLIRKDPNSGNYWEQEKKGRTEDETVGWHTTTHVSEHEFEQTPGDSEGQEVWVAAVHGVAQLDKSERPNNWSFRYILLWTAFCIFVVFTFFLQSICLFFFFFAGILYIQVLCLMYVLQSLFPVSRFPYFPGVFPWWNQILNTNDIEINKHFFFWIVLSLRNISSCHIINIFSYTLFWEISNFHY